MIYYTRTIMVIIMIIITILIFIIIIVLLRRGGPRTRVNTHSACLTLELITFMTTTQGPCGVWHPTDVDDGVNDDDEEEAATTGGWSATTYLV